MRVLLVTSHAAPLTGGSAIVYDQLARASTEIGLLASRLNYETGEPIAGVTDFDRAAPYFTIRVPLLRPSVVDAWRSPFDKLQTVWRMLATTVSVLVACRRFKPDILCVGDLISLGWLVYVAHFLMRRPAVLYVHGEEASYGDVSIFHRLRGRVLRNADAVVAVSSFTAALLRQKYGVERVYCVPNGVDVAHFKLDAEAADAFRRRHDVGDRPLIVGLGRLVERKGFDALIVAMPDVLSKQPDAVCLIAGSGPLRAELEQLIERLSLAPQVRLLGSVSNSDAVALFSAADVFVMPNRTLADGDTEGFGLVFLEANACGTPAIGGRAGGAVDAIQHRESGLLLDNSTPEEVSAAINEILGDPAFRNQLSQGALRWAGRSTWSAALEKFMGACAGARVHYEDSRT